MKKILFICLGNICRSPAAEGVMKTLIEKESLTDKISCDSAGTIGHHAGELPDERMRDHAKQRGYNLNSRSRKFQAPKDFNNFDYLIVMDDRNLNDILSLDAKNEFRGKVYKMTEFRSKFDNTFVPDPYFGGAAGFDLVLDLVEDCSKGLLDKVKNDISDAEKE